MKEGKEDERTDRNGKRRGIAETQESKKEKHNDKQEGKDVDNVPGRREGRKTWQVDRKRQIIDKVSVNSDKRKGRTVLVDLSCANHQWTSG